MNQKTTKCSFKTAFERDFAHADANRKLKLGERRRFRIGFVYGDWQKSGFSRPLRLVLSDDATPVEMKEDEPSEKYADLSSAFEYKASQQKMAFADA